MPGVTLEERETFDVLIIGGGFSGIASLHHIRQKFPSWRVKLLDAAEGPGGTWTWNRYPGIRVDTESISYQYSFDKDILRDWEWRETFSPQQDVLKYIDFVCDRLKLRKDMQFNTKIKTADWQNNSRTWLFADEEGNQYQTRFFVSCLGFLSNPTLPDIPGVHDFKGHYFHTARWPKDLSLSRDLTGKRIGVIGTGATGIQTITAISKEPRIKSLHVFQRNANWSAPLRNVEISAEEMIKHREGYDALFKRCAETPSCFLHQADPRKSSEVTDEERMAHFEKIYNEPGFSKWLGVFSDTYTDREANRLYSDFIASKIRQRVHDPAIAKKLIPKNHGFGTRRVPLESGYFEAYNQANVHLIDIAEHPITEVTATGITTSDGVHHELDVIIYATGFDAITGAFSAIDWHGKDGRPLLGSSGTPEGEHAIWQDFRPRTFLGLTIPAMPNMFVVLGPHQPFGNATRTIEHAVKVVTELLDYCKTKNITYVEPTEEAVEAWTEHVIDCSKGSLINEIDSWMTGVNMNVKGKTVRSVARYSGSAVAFRKRCEEVREKGWEGLSFA